MNKKARKLIFDAWKLSFILPILKYDTDVKIFKFEKNLLRIVFCFVFFIFRLYTIFWDALFDGFMDGVVHYILSIMTLTYILLVIIIYKNVIHIEEIQFKFEKIQRNMNNYQYFGIVNERRFLRTVFQIIFFVFTIFIDSISLLLYTRIGIFINGLTFFMCISAIASFQFFYIHILNDAEYYFKSIYSAYKNSYETRISLIYETHEVIKQFSETFSISILIGFIMEFSFLLATPYWMLFPPNLDTVFHVLRFSMPYLWWLNYAYWVFLEANSASKVEKEVSDNLDE